MVKSIYNKIKFRRSPVADEPKLKRLGYSNTDVMDILSYAALEEQEDYIVIDGKYRRTLFIAGYPPSAQNGWLNSLLHFSSNMDLSLHIERCDDALALKKLHRQRVSFESEILQRQHQSKIITAEEYDRRDTAEQMHTDIIRGESKLFWVSIYVSFVAESLKELNDTTELLESELGKQAFVSRVARAQQIEGFQSVLPRGENVLAQRNDHSTTTAGLMMPFVSSESADPDGILFGINKLNNSLAIIDRFSLPNYNSITFAQSGSGKSYATKVEILRQLARGTSVIVIDPEREYKNLTSSVNGTYIKLSPSSNDKINPFDTASTATSRGELSDHIQSLTELITLMTGGLNDMEAAVLDKAILKVYDVVKDRSPLLEDLHDELKKHKDARELCVRLDRYINGSLAGMFNKQTSIDLENRLVVFDIKDVPSNQMRQLAMMVIANFVENTVKRRPKRRLLVVDEGWLLLQYDESARFIAGLTRRARKYHLGVAMISQQANDFLKSKYGQEIASQSALRILMRQDSTTVREVAAQFKLSEQEEKFISSCRTGEALVIKHQQHISLSIVASPSEHPLITTDPRDKEAE